MCAFFPSDFLQQMIGAIVKEKPKWAISKLAIQCIRIYCSIFFVLMPIQMWSQMKTINICRKIHCNDKLSKILRTFSWTLQNSSKIFAQNTEIGFKLTQVHTYECVKSNLCQTLKICKVWKNPSFRDEMLSFALKWHFISETLFTLRVYPNLLGKISI